MVIRSLRRSRSGRRWIGTLAATAVFAALAVALVAGSGVVSAAPSCGSADVLNATGVGGGTSTFEIDHASSTTVKNKTVNTLGANLTLDSAGCLDWLTTAKGGGTGVVGDRTAGVLVKDDQPSGSGDDAFTGGTSENSPDPIISSGSIPPNKSDLTHFGIYRESNASGKFLDLFWTRQNAPSGTVDMDFELNQLACDPTAANYPNDCVDNATNNASTPNYVTPKRSNGDRLITYDLASGGTVPTISIYTWSGNDTSGSWTNGTVISGAGSSSEALGAINFDSIASNDSGGLGSLDPLTFGEVSISYKALFSGFSGCGTFGSVYLKSRSSNTFTDELKDFIAPEPVQITNCTTLTTSASNQSTAQTLKTTTPTNTISDTATLSGAQNATGTITFTAYGPFDISSSRANDTCTAGNLVFTSTAQSLTGPDTNGDYTASASFTPQSAGRYEWEAAYTSGDSNNASSSTGCGDDNEFSLVKETPGVTTGLSSSTAVPGDKVHDTATLSWSSSSLTPSGTVTYTVYTDNTCTTAASTGAGGAIDAQPAAVTVKSDGTVPDSGDVTFNSPGTYYWQASYGGDDNFNSSKSTCTSEVLVVSKITSTIDTAQSWYPNDSATIGGGGSGTVTFTLYKNDSTCGNNGANTTSAVTGLAGIVVSVSSGSAATNNGPSGNTQNVKVTSVGASGDTYYWLAAYSGDSTHKSVSSCVESTAFTSLDNGTQQSSG